jgi:hypothetical protein
MFGAGNLEFDQYLQNLRIAYNPPLTLKIVILPPNGRAIEAF